MSVPRSLISDDLFCARLIVGMWQVSGAHGKIDPTAAVDEMVRLVDRGLTTFDLADHYGPAEDFIGELRRRLTARGDAPVFEAFTKWVPRPGPMPAETVSEAVDRSCERMATETLDLLQFHWWDFFDTRYLEALAHLADLQTKGRIRHLALTNFSTELLETVLNAGIKVVSNQVLYSVIDQRPALALESLCLEHDIKILAYGTLAGGLLSEAFLNHAPPGWRDLKTPSRHKYKKIIDLWGGWPRFQELMAELATIATKHRVSLPNVAVRFVLERPAVAGAIIGQRLGSSDHLEDNRRVFDFELDDEDRARIFAFQAETKALRDVMGDCGGEYRHPRP